MRKKTQHKIKFRYRFLIGSICTILSIILIFVFFSNCVNPVMIATSESKIRSLTARAVNNAVQTVISETNAYDDLIEITTNEEGKIVLIQAKSLVANQLSKEISKVASQNLDLISSEGISIPLGTLSGISIFVGLGPQITFQVMAISTIQSSFYSEFTSAGINQTNHRIYINLKTTVNLILPTATRTVVVNTYILICEAILIGDIPSTYLNSSSLDEMLNLVPV